MTYLAMSDRSLTSAESAREPSAAFRPGGDLHARPNPDGPATLWLVDDDAETRASLGSLGPLLDVQVSAFADATSFLRAFEPDRPGCIVADAHLDGMSGLALQDELMARRCWLPVIMAIRPGDVRTAVAAAKGGAFEIVEHPLSGDRMAECIRRGVAACRESWAARAEHVTLERRFDRLSPREHEVLRLVVAGLTSRAIAKELGLQEKTIEAYRSHIKHKLRARNAADLVRIFHSV